ncbi:SDR family oxidoreductase [Acidicapsa ligni]|uniref:SDR family oxidoreductase n=1 Tax=Acidicapsa ligni TaxID=542300 RepID=UPI0021DF7F00|nr:SDR family oxidoreductase [Acidicapsa ligni]
MDQDADLQKDRIVIVAGAQGVTGRGVVERYAKLQNTKIYGLSRRSVENEGPVSNIAVDLNDESDIRTKLSVIPSATHLVFGAYVDKSTPAEKSDANIRILRNLLDYVETGQPRLRHITIYQGGKAYGSDLGKYKTPAREDDPRLMPPNYYYTQEDLLRERQQNSSWDYTVLRPGGAICGPSFGTAMNLTMVIAVYAVISRELGLPLRFPGPENVYRAMYQVTSTEILAKATVWAGNAASARNELFNVTNGDTMRWQHMWPRIARMFGMEVAEPVSFSLTTFMADKGPLWDTIVKKHGLQPIPYDQIVNWGFGDFAFRQDFDNVSSTVKVRQAGFADCMDSETMFSTFFEGLRSANLIPA